MGMGMGMGMGMDMGMGKAIVLAVVVTPQRTGGRRKEDGGCMHGSLCL